MSLHTLAHHLQSAGRGDDKVLVHMTPGEVGGLQALAMAHGGSLTINPETGLPEAGFLSSILPMVAGFALAPLTAGTSLSFLGATPLASAMTVGGLTGLMTGDLKKGLMAGLGAYGGAGLGSGLAQTGAANAASAAAPAQSFGMSTAPGASTSVFGNSQLGTALQSAKDASLVQSSNVAANLANTAQAPATLSNISSGVKALGESGGFSNLYNALPTGTLPAAGAALTMGMSEQNKIPQKSTALIRPYTYERTQVPGAYDIGAPMYSATPGTSAEQLFFTDSYTAQKPYKAPGPEYAAEGGLMGMAVGGPVEQMSALNAVGGNTMYPQAQLNTPLYSNPAMQRPEAVNIIAPSTEPAVGAYSGEPKFARGGISDLGDYSDGGRLLKGPGDGVSDSIPAVIGKRQPARLADGEFVVPARIVSELGNGSTEAGARKLYAMMDRVQKARGKSIGKKKVAVDSKAEKLLPA